MSVPAPQSLNAAARLEDSYRVTYDEIAEVRRALGQREQTTQSRAEASTAPLSDADRLRIQQFKEMLAERRATALAAFSAGDTRVDRLRSLLAERDTTQPVTQQAEFASRASPPQYASAQSAGTQQDYTEQEDYGDEDNEQGGYTDAPLSQRDGSPRSRAAGQPVYERLFNSGLSSKLKLDLQRRESAEPTPAAPKINAVSARMRRDSNVEDILLRRSAEYRAHIEELRREKEQKEVHLHLRSCSSPSNLQFTFSWNRYANQKSPKLESKFGARSPCKCACKSIRKPCKQNAKSFALRYSRVVFCFRFRCCLSLVLSVYSAACLTHFNVFGVFGR